jgi:hypothetical protein
MMIERIMVHRWAATVALGMALLAAPRLASAEPADVLTLLDAPVEYTADYSLTQDDQTWHGTVVHASGRERRDFTTSLGTQAILLRRDTDQAAVLWPDRKWYLSTSLTALTGLLGGRNDFKVDRHGDGGETIGGERCDRYKVTGIFTGRIWITHDGILMRAAGTIRLRGKDRAIATQLTHLHRAAVDPDSFELPLGYHGIPVNPRLLEGAGGALGGGEGQ